MSNIFGIVTLKNTDFYTGHALESFFKYTQMNHDDEFFLIDNDGCNTDRYSIYNKIKLIKNNRPLHFAENINQIMDIAIKAKKDLIFLNNDLIFTEHWIKPLLMNSKNISIPSNNQIFIYQSDCGNLKLKETMDFNDFNRNYDLLNNIVRKHKKKFKPNLRFQTLLMPFSCFKIPYKILCEVGHFDASYGAAGGEDVDYRIRCAIKGYEVYFLIDSYLLHFHGKSTWEIETRDQQEKRNKIYREVFLKKWGSDLTQIFILRKDFSNILEEKGLEDLFKEGKFGELIRKILQQKS